MTRANVFFAGAGGSSLGLHNAGYDVVGYEYWQPAINTHTANGMVCRSVDLSCRDEDECILDDATVAWFSPPCQPFSAAGDGEGEFDDRDGFPWTLRIIERTRPQVVFIENVKGLTFEKHAAYLGGIRKQIHDLGYDHQLRVLNCADYGVPQTRERCIIIARCDGGPIVWPAPTHTEQPGMFTEQWVSMAEALGWGYDIRPAPTVLSGGTDTGGAEPFSNASRKAILHYRQNNPSTGEPITCDLTDRPSPTVGTQSYNQWVITRPATTINGDPRVSAPGRHDPEVSGSQQADAIRCTIEELAALQGFPPGFVFTGTKTAQAKQIGNAVPPRLAQVLAEANRPVVEVTRV